MIKHADILKLHSSRSGTAHSARCRSSRGTSRSRLGFTLLDVLVTISVIALLVSLLLPSLSLVTESGRRVVCQSNLRQLGAGLLKYAGDNNELLPPSVFLHNGPGRNAAEPQSMVLLRVGPERQQLSTAWDGLGVLFGSEYLDEPKVFYCPSHQGEYRFRDQASAWQADMGEIIGNFQYRGEGPRGVDRSGNVIRTRFLAEIDPAQSSLIADSVRTRSEFNHQSGANFFRADMSIRWYNDARQRIFAQLPIDKANATAAVVQDVWDEFDSAAAIVPAEQPR